MLQQHKSSNSSPPTVTGHAFHTCETNLPWHNLISFPLSSPPRALLSSPRIYSQTPRAESGSLGFVIISKGRVQLSLGFLLAPEGRVQLSSFFSLPRAESGSPRVFFSDRGPGSALLGFLFSFDLSPPIFLMFLDVGRAGRILLLRKR